MCRLPRESINFNCWSCVVRPCLPSYILRRYTIIYTYATQVDTYMTRVQYVSVVHRSTHAGRQCSVKTISRKFFAHQTLLLPLGNNDDTTKKNKGKNVDGIFLSPKFFSFHSCPEAALFRRRRSGHTDGRRTIVLFCFGFLLRSCECVRARERARV